MIDHTNVDALKTFVSQAEEDREDDDFPLVDETYNLWLGPTGMKASELQELANDADSFNPEADSYESISHLELFVVGLLGLQRIQLVAATSEFKQNPDFNKLKLKAIAERYKLIFRLLDFTVRFPYTIHGGVIDWLGEYYQDLVIYLTSVGENEEASKLLETAFSDLETKLKTISNQDQKAATLSSLGVLHLRKGRLNRSITDLMTGGKHISEANSISPNSQRRKDAGKMLIKESGKNALRTNPLTTIKAVMLGARLLLQN